MTISRRDWLKLGAMAAAGAGAPPALAAPPAAEAVQPPDRSAIDDIVARFMNAFEIPGIALAVTAQGQAPLTAGYGVRVLGRPEAVDAGTRFAIASNTKAFLAACLALLVDDGALEWDEPVTRRLPEFRLQDPAATALMTVRDLLVHRSGLPLGAGDLMIFPKTDHAAEDVLKGLAHFKPATGFRAGYAYDNTLYIVAGLLLERVSGMSWPDFLSRRIFGPLGMTGAAGDITRVRGDNLAGRHGRLGPPVRGLGPLQVMAPSETALVGPAGGIHASVADIVPWLQVQLAGGLLPNGERLWSEAQAAELWRPQTLISGGPGPWPDAPYRSVLQAYALGLGVADYRGRRMLSHSGGLAGQASRTTLLPDQGLAFAIFTNAEDADAVSGLRYALMDALLGAPSFDWLGATRAAKAAAAAKVTAVVHDGDFPAPPGGPSLPLDRYAGRYRDPWYGDVVVSRSADRLSVDFTRTPAFKSVLEPFGADTFRTRFGRGLEDATIRFEIEAGRVTRAALKALSPIADFSFDFHDLDLRPVAG